VSTHLRNILDREETAWKEGALPPLRDQVYCCPQAIDVIQVMKRGKVISNSFPSSNNGFLEEHIFFFSPSLYSAFMDMLRILKRC